MLKTKFPFRVALYILIDYICSFILIFLFFIFVFIGNQIILLAKKIFQITVPFFEVFKLFLLWMPEVVVMSIPYAALVSCLMSVGNFSSSNEFVAMRANGVSFIQSFIPYIFFSLCIMGISFFMLEVVVPWGSIQASLQYRKVLFVSPQLELDQNSVKRYQDNIIITKSVTNNNIQGLVIIDQDNDGNNRIISADTAELVGDQRKGVLSLSLKDVVSISREEKPHEYSYLRAKKLTYNLLVKDLTTEIQSINANQKSISDLQKEVKKEYNQNLKPAIDEQEKNMKISLGTAVSLYSQQSGLVLNSQNVSNQQLPIQVYMQFLTRYHDLAKKPIFKRSYQINSVVYHKKLSEPFAVVVFICIAFPIGLFSKRSGRTTGFGIGITASFLYWLVNVINQTIGATSDITPALVMWYPLVIIFVLSLFLLYIRRRY